MTPSFCWVFLLALVGRARSVPDPIVVDACALLCNPGAETESERARDKTLYPRYPKVNCHPQSVFDDDQAWRIASHCLKLCNEELSVESEVNCFALRSSLGSNLGCYCEALTPLSPNTMRLHESWRLNFLVKELAKDIMTVILDSPLDMMILCEIHAEIYKDYTLSLPERGRIIDICKNDTIRLRSTRSVDKEEDSVLDKDAVEEIIADEEEHKDRVAREVKNSEHSKENDDKDSKSSVKKKLETENKDKERDVTVDSGKDQVKDNTKSDTKHSKNKEDSKNNNERDNAKDNAKNQVENNEENATNNAKNKVKDGSNTRRYATDAQSHKLVEKDTTSNSKTDNVENNSKNEAEDNAKNNEKDSKGDSKKSKPTDQAENAKNDEKRDKRDTHNITDPWDTDPRDSIMVDYDDMINDQPINDDELQNEVTTKEVLLEMMKTSKNDNKKSETTDQAENAKNDEERDKKTKRDTNKMYHTDRTGYRPDYDKHEMMNDQATNSEPTKVDTKELLLELVWSTNHIVNVLNTLIFKLDKTNDFSSKSKE